MQLTVNNYLDMLSQELAEQHYNKSACRKLLFDQLSGRRTEASIEFKHGNISAVLRLLGYPYIKGYQPRGNFQTALLAEVEAQLQQRTAFDSLTQAAVTLPALPPLTPQFTGIVQAAPKQQHQIKENQQEYIVRSPAKRDYLALEARNHSLGKAGEAFVVKFEQWRLEQQGLHGLAAKVEHVAATLGDGLGFDVRSFDKHGKELLIEVKTTSFAKDTPFFVTRNELAVSESEHQKFHLYRLFDFRVRPQLFDLPGQIKNHCRLDAVTFQASFS